jgi:murein DD-endopeptidase MepM/ murein hydrolase activator NlpD
MFIYIHSFTHWLQEYSVIQQRLRQREKVRIGELLVQKGIIDQGVLKQVLAEQSRSDQKLGDVLIQGGWVTEKQLQRALYEQRCRNWTAAILFSLSTLTLFPPKTVVANVTSAIAQGGAQLDNQNESAETPSATLQARRTLFPNSANPFQTPLSANRSPSVNSPLQGFCHPLNGEGYLSQGIRGVTHRGRMEYAYDIAASIGTPLYAMRSGRVIGLQDKYPDTGGGADKITKFNYIMLEHDGGYRSAYMHLQQGFRSKVNLKAGDRVEAGQLMGFSGNSGWSTGPHLHVELQKPGPAYQFTKTVPFAIAGNCDPQTIARAGS